MTNIRREIFSAFRIRASLKMILFTGFMAVLLGLTAIPAAATPSRHGTGDDCRSKVFDLVALEDIPSDGKIGVPSNTTKLLRGSVSAETETYIPLVVIVIGFEGQPYNNTYDWNEMIFQGEVSLKQYYKDMSFGKFTFQPVEENSRTGFGGNTNENDRINDGIIFVSLDMEKTYGWAVDYDYYTRLKDLRSSDLESMIAFDKALQLAGDYMDFSRYDSDKDGKIQTTELAVGFVVAGRDAAYHASRFTSKTIGQYFWPHAYSFTEFWDSWEGYPGLGGTSGFPEVPLVDGVRVDSYIGIAETYETFERDGKYASDGGELKQEPFGTLAHELGHYLGLPDLYDTVGSGSWGSYDSMYLSLMNQGSYGEDVYGNPIPFSLDIWSRVELRWVTPELLTPGSAASVMDSLDPSGTYPVALRIDTTKDGEYYLIENRRFTRWDTCLGEVLYNNAILKDGEDPGGGLLIWHIDQGIMDQYLQSNEVNGGTHHPGIVPLYWEYTQGNKLPIGTGLSVTRAFYSKDLWGENLVLPLYGTVNGYKDKPRDRVLSNLALYFDTGSLPVMDVHLIDWAGEEDNPNNPVRATQIIMDSAAFSDYKSTRMRNLLRYVSDDDSEETIALCDEGVDAIDSLLYDESLSLDENKEKVDEIYEQYTNMIQFQRNKEEAVLNVESLLELDDGETAEQLIQKAIENIKSLDYGTELTLEQNQEILTAIIDQLQKDLNTQRNNDYKAEVIADAEKQKQEDDSDAVQELIDGAKEAIGNLPYDDSMTLEENRAEIDKILEELKIAIEEQREKDKKADYVAHIEELKKNADRLSSNNALIIMRIEEAKDVLDGLDYDEELTLAENMEIADQIFSELVEDVTALREEEAREKEERDRRNFYATMVQGRELLKRLEEERLEEEKKNAVPVVPDPEEETKIPFTDVNPLMADVVRYVYENDIMNGVSDTEFNPYGTLNRGMIVTTLYRLEGEPSVTYNGTFTDVKAGEWYTSGVEWASVNGIVNGYGNGIYGPEKPVTREQLAAILYRYANWKGWLIRTADLTAADADEISDYAVAAMSWAVDNDVIWVSNTEVRPTENALRWEVAVAIQALCENVAK